MNLKLNELACFVHIEVHFESLDFFIDIGIIIEIIVNSFSHCITLLVFLVFIEWNIFLWSLGNRNLWKVSEKHH